MYPNVNHPSSPNHLVALSQVEHADCTHWFVEPDGTIMGEAKDVETYDHTDAVVCCFVRNFLMPEMSEYGDVDSKLVVPKRRDDEGYLLP